ncbi:MAG: ECF transporter S component [Erysipelotrichaceae bacterium]|nr:ECF transporter S component [Erysipelotrichaceae bacterium]
MKTTRKMTYLALGIALYVAVSVLVKIPIVNRIRLDLGYLVFGMYLCYFGKAGTLVGVAGCILAHMLTGGSFPIAWAIAQTFIGLVLGFLYEKEKRTFLRVLYAVLILFLGIEVLKSVLEILFFRLPPAAKFLSSLAAYIVDLIPFVIGVFLSDKIKLR